MSADRTEVFNRDIIPSLALSEAFPALAPLIINAPITVVFRLHDHAAMRLKRMYGLLGVVGLFAVLIVMVSSSYQFTLGRVYGSPLWLTWATASGALIGVASQLVLELSSVKQKWRTRRFLAERCRCLKFELFGLVPECVGAGDVKTVVERATLEGLARLDQEAMAGPTAILRFNPSELSLAGRRETSVAGTKLLEDAYAVYDTLRLGLQLEHFEGQRLVTQEKTGTPAALSQATFGIGALLAVAQIIALIAAEQTGMSASFLRSALAEWGGFLSLTLFIISAVVAVYQRGTAHLASAERYTNYAREIRHLRLRTSHEPAKHFTEAVSEMERLALRELFDFCRDSDASNFIL